MQAVCTAAEHRHLLVTISQKYRVQDASLWKGHPHWHRSKRDYGTLSVGCCSGRVGKFWKRGRFTPRCANGLKPLAIPILVVKQNSHPWPRSRQNRGDIRQKQRHTTKEFRVGVYCSIPRCHGSSGICPPLRRRFQGKRGLALFPHSGDVMARRPLPPLAQIANASSNGHLHLLIKVGLAMTEYPELDLEANYAPQAPRAYAAN